MDEKEKAVSTATAIAGIGATAGVGIAALVAGPLLLCALIGAGVGALGGAAIVGFKGKGK